MKKILILFCSLFVLSSCENALDSTPAAQVSDVNFWKTQADATAGVSSIYDVLQRDYYVYAWAIFNDGLTPNGWIWSDAGLNYVQIAKGQPTPALAGAIADKWKSLYKGIFRANLALENLPKVTMDETLKTRLLAESRFLRALFYYNLVDFYGGVPILTANLKLGAALPARNTKAEVINFIVTECSDIENVLPATYIATNVGRATKGAAMMLKAKAYLLNGNFEQAAVVAKQIIDGKAYSLYTNYEAMFSTTAAENNAEVIFDVQYASGMGEGSPIDGRFSPLSSFSRGWNAVFPTVEFVDSYEMTNGKAITDPTSGYNPATPYVNRDPRLDYTVIRPGGSWRGIPYANISLEGGASTRIGYILRKQAITADANRDDSPLNFIVFRYADVLLMYAEARNEATGPDATVYDALNQVRARTGVNMPAVTSGKTKEQLRDIIRHERQIELAFEGIYYSDIRRWGIAKDLMNNKVIRSIQGSQLDTRNFIDAFYLWPIPQGEIDLNPGLKQNPGYN